MGNGRGPSWGRHGTGVGALELELLTLTLRTPRQDRKYDSTTNGKAQNLSHFRAGTTYLVTHSTVYQWFAHVLH